MRSLNLVSLTVLAAIVFAVRCLVLPAIESMPRPERVRFMGKLMPRARRMLSAALIVFIGSAFGRVGLSDLGSPADAREVLVRIATILVTVVLVPLTLSPHRSVALRVESHRKTLLTIALFLLSALLVLAS